MSRKSRTLKRLTAKRDRAQALLSLVDAAERLARALECGGAGERIDDTAEGVAVAYRELESLS